MSSKELWLHTNDSFERHNQPKEFVAGRFLMTWKQISVYGVVSVLLSWLSANVITFVTGYWTIGSFMYGITIGVGVAAALLHGVYRKVDHQHPLMFWIENWWNGVTAPREPGAAGRVRVSSRMLDPKVTTRFHYPTKK